MKVQADEGTDEDLFLLDEQRVAHHTTSFRDGMFACVSDKLSSLHANRQAPRRFGTADTFLFPL